MNRNSSVRAIRHLKIAQSGEIVKETPDDTITQNFLDVQSTNSKAGRIRIGSSGWRVDVNSRCEITLPSTGGHTPVRPKFHSFQPGKAHRVVDGQRAQAGEKQPAQDLTGTATRTL